MRIIGSAGDEAVALVYLAETGRGRLVEFVESLQPPLPRHRKWVAVVSTMIGCPVGCAMCDAGGSYQGRLTREEILAQIDFLVRRRFPSGSVPCGQFKIQFARMGEPALNAAVLDVLDELPRRYDAPGLLPSISTVAPAGADAFFERLLAIKAERYSGGRFQLQFSLHTTDAELRDRLVPARKLTFAEMADYVERFHAPRDRKVTLNFALARGMPVDARALLAHFDPGKCLIKITPLNPTYRARESRLATYIDPASADEPYEVVEALRAAGYEVIISIGAAEENRIGSNCGQYVRRHLEAGDPIRGGYTYRVRRAD